MVKELTTDNLEEIVKQTNKVIAQFVLSWDEDCKKPIEDFKELATSFSDIEFVSVDVEKNPQSLKLITAEVFPTTAFFENGKNKAQTRTKKIDSLKNFITENK